MPVVWAVAVMTGPSYEARAVAAVAGYILGEPELARQEMYALEVPELRVLCQSLHALASMAAQVVMTKTIASEKP